MTFLTEILDSTQEVVRSSKLNRPLADLKKRVRDRDETRPFTASLAEGSGLKLIAELKQASPSQGILRTPFVPDDIARIYEEEGAAALSVLTEERFFRGSLSYLDRVRKAVKRPLLRKDFLITEYQIYEARAFGADAVLLIAAVLEDSRLKDFQDLAADLAMDCLVEVHSGEELDRTIRVGSRLIGINNRDLATFKTDLDVTRRLIPEIPDDRVVVSESGIARRADVQGLKEAGVDAVLIGETFMRSSDIRAKVRELMD